MWRGQEFDNSERVKLGQEGRKVERSCLTKKKGQGERGAGEERKVYSLGQAVKTRAECSP